MRSIEARHLASISQDDQAQIDGIAGGPAEKERFVDQKDGLTRLKHFLFEQQDYEILRPFVLDVSRAGRKNRPGKERICYSLGGKGRPLLELKFSPELKDIAIIYVMPHQERGRTKSPYYWLTFNSEDPTRNISNLPFAACRLQPEGKPKIDFQHWHGVEEQLLADFVLGENEITFEDIVPFDIHVRNRTQISVYRIAAKEGLKLHVTDSRIKDGDTLRCIPYADENSGDCCMDILRIDPNIPEQDWKVVASYRLLRGEHRLRSKMYVERKSNFWTRDVVDKESLDFHRTYGVFSTNALTTHGRSDLGSAIKKYGGGISATKKRLGMRARRAPGYWTPERTRIDSAEFYKQHKLLTHTALIKKGRIDISGGVEKYPGGIKQLRLDIGVQLVTEEDKQVDWSHLTTIDQWVEEFTSHPEWLEKSISQMTKKNEAGFRAFYRKFHMWLGMAVKNRQEYVDYMRRIFPDYEIGESTISPEEAREELQKLLEVKNE